MGQTTRQILRLVAGVALVSAAASSSARAAYTVIFEQVGSDVVATGSGSIDLTGLEPFGAGPSESSEIYPSLGVEIVSGNGVGVGIYTGISGPTSFGSGGFFSTFTQTGDDAVGINASSDELLVTGGYASGAPLSGTATFANETFATLGLTPGTYVYTWGGGVDSYTVKISSVPELSSWAMMVLGFAGLAFTGWRAGRKTASI